MLFPESRVTIWLHTKPTDMRKSYTGLAAIVKNQLQSDPLSGHLFMFINRKKTQTKILYFEYSGYCIWSKKLERGLFNYNKLDDNKQRLNWTQLRLIIEGIELKSIKKNKRYQRNPPDS